MEKLRSSTLLFLVKKQAGQVVEICLAMKKRGFGAHRWNGVGGKVESGETIENAARRETREEIGVDVSAMEKVAELEFRFKNNPDWNQLVHVYRAEVWNGVPSESEEMRPGWFAVADIPFNNMWPDDIFWLPHVLAEKKIKAAFLFGEGDGILEKKVEVVEVFNN